MNIVFKPNECAFGLYDYIDADTNYTCAKSTYTVRKAYKYAPFPQKSGWYGYNSCDAPVEEPPTEPVVDPVVPDETCDPTVAECPETDETAEVAAL